MKPSRLIRRLFAILLIAGFALTPVSQPGMARTAADMHMQAMANEMSASAVMDEMANDMPCCPSKAAAPVGCDNCVFMACSTGKSLTGMSMVVFHPLLTASENIAAPKNDSSPDGLGSLPPEHPPRTLV